MYLVGRKATPFPLTYSGRKKGSDVQAALFTEPLSIARSTQHKYSEVPIKSNLLSFVLLFGFSISFSQLKNLQKYDPNELLLWGQVDSSSVYAKEVTSFALEGQWEYALHAAEKDISYLYRQGRYSIGSYVNYFSAAFCCPESFGDNHPLIKELRKTLQSILQDRNEDNSDSMVLSIFRKSYLAPKQSLDDYRFMFAAAFTLGTTPFAKAISLTYRELNIGRVRLKLK